MSTKPSDAIRVTIVSEQNGECIEVSSGEGLFAPLFRMDAGYARWLASRLNAMADVIDPQAKQAKR